MITITRQTHKIDAADQILGRLASKIAVLLQGKHKKEYAPHLDLGDIVEVTGASKIKLSGNKFKNKIYYSHSRYPKGLKAVSFEKMFAQSPTKVLRLAVSRMLPKNKLQAKRILRLKIYD